MLGWFWMMVVFLEDVVLCGGWISCGVLGIWGWFGNWREVGVCLGNGEWGRWNEFWWWLYGDGFCFWGVFGFNWFGVIFSVVVCGEVGVRWRVVLWEVDVECVLFLCGEDGCCGGFGWGVLE